MRLLPLALLCLALGCDGPKQGPPAVTAPPVGHAFDLGDPAPPLSDAIWLHGTPVTLAPGRVYVIDFWATWCGYCLKAMPHLDELARQFGPQGVTVVTVATADQNGNTRDAVEKYIRDTGHQFDLHFAFCTTTKTYEDWMYAAGQDAFPCCMVVDKNGKLAFVGSPHELDAVLPKIVAGTWQGANDLQAIAGVEKKLQEIILKIDVAGNAAVEKLREKASDETKEAAYDSACRAAAMAVQPEMDAFLKAHPWKAAENLTKARLMGYYMFIGKYDDAKTQAEAILPVAIEERNAIILEQIRLRWVKRRYNPERLHVELAVRAADAMLTILGDTDAKIVLNAAETYAVSGDKVKYEAAATKARRLEAHNPDRLKKVEDALKSFQ